LAQRPSFAQCLAKKRCWEFNFVEAGLWYCRLNFRLKQYLRFPATFLSPSQCAGKDVATISLTASHFEFPATSLSPSQCAGKDVALIHLLPATLSSQQRLLLPAGALARTLRPSHLLPATFKIHIQHLHNIGYWVYSLLAC